MTTVTRSEVVKEIRKIMNSNTISGKSTNETSIINAVVRKSASDTEITQFFNSVCKKGKTSAERIISIAKDHMKKINRTKHAFNTINEYNEFSSKNECGEMWIENNKYCTYCY